MLDEPRAERLDVLDRMLLGQRVHHVAHRVGGQQAGVVSIDVRGLEVALEPHVDGEVAQVVAAGPARDLDQADLGLSVPGRLRPFDIGQLPRYVLYPNGLSSSGTW